MSEGSIYVVLYLLFEHDYVCFDAQLCLTVCEKMDKFQFQYNFPKLFWPKSIELLDNQLFSNHIFLLNRFY